MWRRMWAAVMEMLCLASPASSAVQDAAAAGVSNPEPSVGASVYPVRVIDVEKTVGSGHGNVVFSKPMNWEFHTISHTWSKGVQSWSNIIASKLMVAQSNGAAVKVSYEDLFEGEDFSWHECYAPFLEFLRLLRADGVKQVWLDALCINQGSESGEKSQELQKMGSFYAESLGCYVCAHGFGEGFETWKKTESELAMPRWFSRVWTFQEMLLPKTLTFILDIRPVVRRTINWCISEQAAQGINGPCKCALGLHPFPKPERLLDGEENEEEYFKERAEICRENHDRQKDVKKRGVEIMCGDVPCSQCGGAALIRRAKDHALMQQQSLMNASTARDLYFIDRQCIIRLMIMTRLQQFQHAWTDSDDDAERKLLRLETIIEEKELKTGFQVSPGDDDRSEQGWDPIQVAVEISKRDCTHDEDRILSILGLLGLEGAVQLRAGKTLDVQLLHLAQQLVMQANQPTALVKLCVAQYAGHGRPGMSWAPSLGAKGGLRPTGEARPTAPSWRELRRNKQMLARQTEVEEASEMGLLQLGRVMRYFARSLEVESVSEDGPLLCTQAKVLWGCSFERVGLQHLFNLHITSSADHHCSFPFQAYFSPSSCLLHHSVIIAGHSTLANQSMVRLEGTQLDARLRSFQVCLVLLGQLHLPREEKHEVMMVCVGNRCDGLLHKVGLAWLPGLEQVLSLVHPSSMVTLGGFDDYMDRFVFV